MGAESDSFGCKNTSREKILIRNVTGSEGAEECVLSVNHFTPETNAKGIDGEILLHNIPREITVLWENISHSRSKEIFTV